MGAMIVERGALVVLLVGLAGCAGGTLEPASGTLEVTASVVGDGADVDGFQVVVSRTIQRPVMPGQSVFLNAIAPGDYDVGLEGIAPNCTPLRPMRISVSVTAGDTVKVAFIVTCNAAVGQLRVTVQTAGSDRDPSGYDVLVDNARVTSSDPDGIVISTVPAGDRTVTLGAINPNCVATPPSHSLVVPIGGLVTTEFEIQCTASARAGRGREIAYTSSDESGHSSIYVVNDDGSHTELLFPDITASHDTPAWGPDGSRIAFYITPSDSMLALTVADVESGQRTQFSQSIDLHSMAIGWSRDGSRLALGESTSDPCPPIRIFRVDGTGEQSLDVGCYNSASSATFNSFAWSPDGQQIAFVVHVEELTPPGEEARAVDILARADINLPGQSTSIPGCTIANARSVAWSPDGSSLAIAAGGIFVLDLASAVCSKLTEDTSAVSPSWSPDGTRLAFSSNRDGNSDIYVMQADGSNQTRITRSSGAGAPSWRP